MNSASGSSVVEAELVHHLDEAPVADLVAGDERVEIAHDLHRLAHVAAHDREQVLVHLAASASFMIGMHRPSS